MTIFGDPKPHVVCELDPSQIYAAAMVGDNWVQISLMHLDPRGGGLYPIRSKYVMLDTLRRHTPSIQQIVTGLRECWHAVGEPSRIEYGRFFLCLPPWCCHGREARAEIAIEYDSRIPWKRAPSVHTNDVRDLEERICTAGVLPNYVTTDLIPYGYVLDSGREVADPVGAISKTLELKAYVVMAEYGLTKAILDGLREIDVQVDSFVSPWTATENMLSRGDRERGVAVIDVGRRNTCCSFYQRGSLRYVARVEGGSEDVAEKTGSNLHITQDALKACFDEWRKPVSAGKGYDRFGELPLFHWAWTHPGLRQLDVAAAQAAEQIFHSIERQFVTASREMMVDFREIVFVGDDPMASRNLMDVVSDRTGVRCRQENPHTVYGAERVAVLSYARSTGMVRQCVNAPCRQVFLERYNEGVLDVLDREVRKRVRRAFWWTARRYFRRMASRAKRRLEREKTPPPKELEKGLRVQQDREIARELVKCGEAKPGRFRSLLF